MQYHFKVRNSMATPGDALDQDLDSFETVRQQALEIARHIARARAGNGHAMVDVTDDTGEVVLSLEISPERGVTMTYPPLESGAMGLE